MKKTTKSSVSKPVVRKTSGSKPALFHTWEDARNGLLIVSLLANLFGLCIWITLQVTSHYDSALIDFFIHR